MINRNDDIGPEKRILSVEDIVKGIGRKATNEELIVYLDKGRYCDLIDIDLAFDKYINPISLKL